jgi:hypothetical protein
MSFLKPRGSSSSPDRGSGSFAATAEDLARWPAILEFVGAEQWPDGSQRVPGSLVLFVEQGRLKGCLSDKDQGLVLFVTGCGLLDLMDGLEATLEGGNGDWRPTRSARAGKRPS